MKLEMKEILGFVVVLMLMMALIGHLSNQLAKSRANERSLSRTVAEQAKQLTLLGKGKP